MVEDMWHSVDEEEMEALAEKVEGSSGSRKSTSSWSEPSESFAWSNESSSAKKKDEPRQRESMTLKRLKWLAWYPRPIPYNMDVMF